MKLRASELSGSFRAPRIRNTYFRLVSMQNKLSVPHSTAEALRTQGQQEPRNEVLFRFIGEVQKPRVLFMFQKAAQLWGAKSPLYLTLQGPTQVALHLTAPATTVGMINEARVKAWTCWYLQR